MKRNRKLHVAAGTLVGVAALSLGGVAVASASGASGGSSASGTDQQEAALTGDTRTKASDAALKAAGGGKVTDSEASDDPAAPYEVEVTLDNGDQVDVVSSAYLSAGSSSLGWGPQGLGLGYPHGAAILSSLLVLTFVLWRATGHPFSLRKITSFKAEALFWTAILISNTLGTSLGDFLSDSTGLGYAGGAALIAGILAVIGGLYFVPRASNTLLFWAAFVLTARWERPWVTSSPSRQ